MYGLRKKKLEFPQIILLARFYNLHFYTIFILTIKDSHGLDSFRNRSATADENTIDIESEGKRIGRWNIFRGLR